MPWTLLDSWGALESLFISLNSTFLIYVPTSLYVVEIKRNHLWIRSGIEEAHCTLFKS